MKKPVTLKNIEQWKAKNAGDPFSIYDYIFQEIQMNNVSSDIYLTTPKNTAL